MKKVLLFLLVGHLLFAHDLVHQVKESQAIVVQFSFGNKEDFSYQSYEVYAPKSSIPFVVGRTDKLSRVVFVPNVKGEWKIKALSEDGHGKVVTIEVNENFKIKDYSKTPFEKFQKILVGLALIFFVFMLIKFFKGERA